MLRFYYADIFRLPDPAVSLGAMAGLPKERQEKCQFYHRSDDRKRCLGAGLITRRLIEDHGCDPALSFGNMGKPQIEGVHFNLSHGGRYVIGVASPCPVGCDIEPLEDPPLEIASHYFHHGEIAYLNAHPDPSVSFWQLWTLKESYMKMTGEGMSLALDAFQMVMQEPVSVMRGGRVQPCGFRHLLWRDHAVAFCFEDAAYACQPVIWEFIF